MTNERSLEQIQLALSRGFISTRQADALKEELFMFPGGNIGSLMVRRGMITPDQAKILEAGADDDADTDLEPIDGDPGFEILSGPAAGQANIPFKPAPSPEAPALKPQIQRGNPQVARQQPAMPQHQRIAPGQSVRPSPGGAGVLGQTGRFLPDPQLVQLLMAGRNRGGSDLHISVGKPPYLRVEGKLEFLPEPPLAPQKAEQMCLSVLAPEQRAEFEATHQVDFSFAVAGAGRFRANVYRQRLGVEGAFRFIPVEVPTMASLGLPPVLEKLTAYPQGLNLVTGPGGCGKTTTVAAMVEHINRHRHEHIITVEDPVEYVFQPKNCQVTQREVGTHTASFAHALRTALRQDPDVIMIGELRDLETTSISITAAETGHLVFGTLHTSSAVRTVARILDVYPPTQRAQICLMIAESLRGIISQQLVPRADGKGRVCAMEILLVTTGVSQVIKEGKTHQLVSHMQSGRRQGMISLDDALMELFQSGAITEQEAYQRAENKGMFALRSQ
jgi:twitching motility protein PilT